MANTTDPNTPTGRIAAAIAGKPAEAHVEVLTQDLAAVCGHVPATAKTDVTNALTQGATGALAGRRPVRAAKQKSVVKVAHLAALLGAVGVVAQ